MSLTRPLSIAIVGDRSGRTTIDKVKRARRWMLWMLASVMLVGGCTALQPPREESPDLYVLGAAPTIEVARAKRDAVVEIAAPRAWPGFDTPQMAYVREPHALDYFTKSQWADTPPRMLGPLLVQALEQGASFRAVVQSPSVVPADLRVDSELVRLQQNFATRPSRVELTLRVQLIDVRAKRVLAIRLFDETENAPTEDAHGGVVAANAALQRLLEKFVDFCVVESGAR